MMDFRKRPDGDTGETMFSVRFGGLKLELRSGYLWVALTELILLELALIGGATAVWKHPTLAEDWHMLFVALGALCLGFGAALLLVHHLIQRQAKEMDDEVASLVESAATLALTARHWKAVKDQD